MVPLKNSLLTFLVMFLAVSQFFFSVSANPHDLEIYNNDPFAKEDMKGMCSVCHVDPNGGGPRNEFGQVFEANNEVITNNIRKQFPELFDLFHALAPMIKRIKPRIVTVGKETELQIIGKNFTKDIFLHIDSVSIESLPHIKHEIINSTRAVVTVNFDTPGKHIIHFVSPLGLISNTYNVIAKPVRSRN